MNVQFPKKQSIVLTLLLALVIANCTDSPPSSFDYEKPEPVDTLNAGDLIWSDEFTSSGAPNSNNWTYDLGNGVWGWGNAEVQTYTDDPKNVKVENGFLSIKALKEGSNWTSARLKTQGLKEFKYVTVKVRAMLPEGSGTWPAIWMLGSDIETAGWPDSGEIDIMEHVGKDPGMVHSSLHTPSSYGNTQNSHETFISDYNTEFHVYEAEWTTDAIIFRIDGNEFYTYSPSSKTSSTWPFNNDFFIILNVAMGGNWGSDPQYETDNLRNGIDPDLSSAEMLVDYVRVYKN